MEPKVASVFGVPQHSVSLIVWEIYKGQRCYWIPKRLLEAEEHPDEYDFLISGTLRSYVTHLERLKELAETFGRLALAVINDDNVKYCDTICYHHLEHDPPKEPICRPYFQYVYDLRGGPSKVPSDGPPLLREKVKKVKKEKKKDKGREGKQDKQVKDDEESNDDKEDECQAYPWTQVWDMLKKGTLQPHAQMAFLAILIKHGHVTTDLEPDLERIQKRLHREIAFPQVWT